MGEIDKGGLNMEPDRERITDLVVKARERYLELQTEPRSILDYKAYCPTGVLTRRQLAIVMVA